MVLEDIAIEELKGHIVPEHSFSYAVIGVEFMSKAHKRYQARFSWGKRTSSSIELFGLDRDREDLESVIRTMAREMGGKLPMIKRTTRLFRRTKRKLKITDHPEDATISSRVLLSSPLTQERVAYFVERIREHFRDVRITTASFHGVRIEKVPGKYLRRVYTKVIEGILNAMNGFIEEVSRYGATYLDSLIYDEAPPDTPAPTGWQGAIRGYLESAGTYEEVLMELRELREGYRQAMEEMSFLRPIGELAAAEKREEEELEEVGKIAVQDRAKLDAEIEDWAASIDKRETKEWITEEFRKSEKKFSKGFTFYGLQSSSSGEPRICLTPEALRESKFEDESLGYILVTFVSEANIPYLVVHICENYVHTRRFRRYSLKGPSISLEQTPAGLSDKEDYVRVRGIVERETGGECGNFYTFNAEILGIIHLKDNPTKSRVADYIERYEKHFKDVRVDLVFFEGVPEEGHLRKYVSCVRAREILGVFDMAVGLDRHGASIDRLYPPFAPMEVSMIMEEQDCKLPFSFKPRDEHSRAFNNYIYVTRGKFLRTKEIYRQVMEEMGLVTSE